LFWLILVGVLGFLIAFIPARIGGGILASILCRVQKQHNLALLNGFLIGAAVGLIAGLMICLPIVALNYELVITTGHGDSDVFIYRTIVASTIAASMAGLVGRRLAEQLPTIN
jgi:hypothetical protein